MRDCRSFEPHKEHGKGSLYHMAEKAINPPHETRKPLYALEYERRMKEIRNHGEGKEEAETS